MKDERDAHRERRGFARIVAGYFSVLYGGMGLYFPLYPLWLEARHLDPRMIGIVLAAPSIIRIIGNPVIGAVADRTGNLARVIAVSAVLTGLFVAATGLVDGFWPILIGTALFSLFWGPLVPLGDAFAMRGLTKRKSDYGRVRMWGSVAFIAGTLAAGAAVALVAPGALIWVFALSFAPIVLVAWLLPAETMESDGAVAHPKGRGTTIPFALFLLVLAAAALVNCSHAMIYGFSSLHWRSLGFSGPTIGVLWSIGVLVEVFIFAFAARLFGAIDPLRLILLSGIAGALRWSGMALDPPLPVIVLLQALHGLSYTAMHLGILRFIQTSVLPAYAARGQSLVSTSQGIAMTIATVAAGYAYGAFGAKAFLAMVGFSLAGIALTLIAIAWQRSRAA